MAAAIRRNREAASAGLAPAQADLTYGSRWIRFWDKLVIFGTVPTLMEVGLAEQELGADPDEVAYTISRVEVNLTENDLLYGTCYSVIEPTGEIGNTHKSSVWPIEDSLFEAARNVTWNPALLPPSALLEVYEAMAAWTGQQMKARGQ